MRSFANEIGNLAQVVGRRVKGINTIYFIKHEDMPWNQNSTYGCIVVYYCPHKEDQFQTRLTVRVNLINYPGYVGTPKSDILTSRFFFNRLLLNPYYRFIVTRRWPDMST